VNALEISGLSLQAGAFRLRDVDLVVGPSEYFALMGHTGSGKSLLLKSVCGLARIKEGSIRLDGREISALEPRFRDIGYVPQDGGLFPHLTVLRNIVFPLVVRGTSVKRSVEQVRELVALLGLEALLERSTRALSGGERQKVALARALARQPKLLILDEPVCALDEPTRRDICGELRRVQQEFGIATLHVCHSREEAEQVSDRIGVMHEGRLVASGHLDQVVKTGAHEAVRRLFSAPDCVTR
jgi:ABC-type sugar transport system ATPase subunit